MLYKESFKGWLQGKEPETVVGNARQCVTCPLATYLTEKGGFASVSVTVSYLTYFLKNGEREGNITPVWMFRFIHAADLKPLNAMLTAGDCLNILEKC